jgi:hypothetical protein
MTDIHKPLRGSGRKYPRGAGSGYGQMADGTLAAACSEYERACVNRADTVPMRPKIQSDAPVAIGQPDGRHGCSREESYAGCARPRDKPRSVLGPCQLFAEFPGAEAVVYALRQ